MSTAVPHALGPYAGPLLGPTWALFGLALILTLARIYTSRQMTHAIGLDLYLAVLTFALGSISLAFFTVAVRYGLGQHFDVLSLGQQIIAMRNSWLFTSVSLFTIAIGKLTVIAFLQQLHGPNSRYRTIFLWSLGTSNVVVNAITVALALASCSPMAKLWNPTLPGKCDGILRNQDCAYFQGSWNAMADLILALYPVSLVYRLQMQRILKIGLCALMGLGIVACACAIVKTVKLENISKSDDTTFYVGQLNFWNAMEMWVIFIVACIPPIRKLLVSITRKLVSTISSKARTGGTDGSTIELRSNSTLKGSKEDKDTGYVNILRITDIDVETYKPSKPGL